MKETVQGFLVVAGIIAAIASATSILKKFFNMPTSGALLCVFIVIGVLTFFVLLGIEYADYRERKKSRYFTEIKTRRLTMENFIYKYFWWAMATVAVLAVSVLKELFNMTMVEALIWTIVRCAILYGILISIVGSIMFWGIFIHKKLESHEGWILGVINVFLMLVLVFAFFRVYWMTTPNALIMSSVVTVVVMVVVYVLAKQFTSDPRDAEIHHAQGAQIG